MNRAVLALKHVREAIGSEWRHRNLSGSVTLLGINERDLMVEITEVPSIPMTKWPILLFLKNFKPTLPKDQVPSWYTRLLADKIL